MKLSRLHTFVRLAELKSFSLAAEELGLTQPAVSIQVKTLEEYFGVQLVERLSDGIALTTEGVLLYEEARKMLKIWRNIGQQISQLSALVKGELNLNASTIPAEYLLPELIVNFCKTYPLISLKMEVGDSSSVIQDILKRRVDLGIVGFQPEAAELITMPIAADELALVVPKGHPFAMKEKITTSELLQEVFIMREEGSGTRKVMRDGLAQIGLNIKDLRTIARLGSTESVVSAVEAGLGLAIVSSLAAKRAEKLQRLKVVQIAGFHVGRQFYLCYLAEAKNQILIQKFVEYLREKSETFK